MVIKKKNEYNKKEKSLLLNPLDLTETDIFDECPFKPPDPWHESVLKLMDVKHNYQKDCVPNPNLTSLTELDNGMVFVKEGNATVHENGTDIIKDYKEIYDCGGRCILYHNDKYHTLGERYKLLNGTKFTCDMIAVECSSVSHTDRRQIHMQLVEQRVPGEKSRDPQKNPDVLLMVIDSVAFTQAIRALPKTVNFLKHGMEAVEFRKLNRVGMNSRPNAFALLFGKTVEPITRMLFNLSTIPANWYRRYYCESNLEKELYIPFEYQSAGYKTFDGEDYGASILYYPDCIGMPNKRYHHSYRPLHSLLKDSMWERTVRKDLCQSSHNIVLDYLSLFVNSYEDLPKFSLTWLTEMTHDDTASLYKADTDLYEFFLKNKNALNNSFIFIMADHGPRIGEEAYTYFGLREQNNPLLYIVVPKHLRKSGMHEQLLENSGELVTPHDLHSTLKDILYFQPESTFTDLKYKRFDSNPYGSSLLRKFESGVRRSCKTLPIPFQYCICQYEKKIITDKGKLAVLGNYSVARLVSTLDSHEVLDECQPIALSEVLLAEEYLLPDRNFLGTSIHLYYVVFTVALPAEGKFEVFIREDENGDLYLDPLTFLRIDRIYHKTSCIDIDKLFGLCTCKRA